MMSALAVVLLLQPVLAEPSEVRLIAAGTGDDVVQWTVDGEHVATTKDREAAVVILGAGTHRIEAQSEAPGVWTAVARPVAPPGSAGLTFMPAWSATSHGRPEPRPTPTADWLPILGLGLAVIGAAVVRRTGNQGASA